MRDEGVSEVFVGVLAATVINFGSLISEMAACRRLAAAAVLLVACAGAPMRSSADTPTTLQAAAASSGVESPRRVAWLHVPKTGTSFATTLMHYANSSLPADARANNGGRCTGVEHDPTVYDAQVPCDKSEVHATTFALDYPFATWFQGSFPVGMESTSPHTRKSEVAWVGGRRTATPSASIPAMRSSAHGRLAATPLHHLRTRKAK